MEQFRDDDSDPRERWIHELRNVVNVLGSGMVLSRRLIEKGRADEARDVLAEAERSLQRCYALLDAGVPVLGQETLQPHAGSESDARLSN